MSGDGPWTARHGCGQWRRKYTQGSHWWKNIFILNKYIARFRTCRARCAWTSWCAPARGRATRGAPSPPSSGTTRWVWPDTGSVISPNDVTLQALLRRMFGENQVGETWKWDNERMESIMDLQFSFDSDPASSDNEVSRQDLGYPGQVIWTHEVRDAGMVINQRLLMRWRWSFPYTEMIPGLIFN